MDPQNVYYETASGFEVHEFVYYGHLACTLLRSCKSQPAMEHLCSVCGRTIDDHRARQRLESDSIKDCAAVLVDIASQHALHVAQLLQAAAGDSRYLCKHPCFNDVRD